MMNNQMIDESKIKIKSNHKKQNNIMNYMELVIILVVQLTHLVLLGVLVGPGYRGRVPRRSGYKPGVDPPA